MVGDVFYRKWDVEHPRAILYIVHGLGEHCGRYEDVARWFNARGVAVYSGDYTGFGQTKGKRGHAKSVKQIIDVIIQGIRYMIADHPDTPRFILGHSLGGLLATELLLTRSYDVHMDGAIITSPGYRPAFEIPAWKNMLAKILTPLMPSLALPSGLPVEGLSRDAKVVSAYIVDPLVHDKVSLRLYQEINRTMDSVFQHAHELPPDLPIYWMQGEADSLVDPTGAKQFFDLLPTHPLRKYKGWEGLYHEILNEPEKEQVLEEIDRFLEQVIPRVHAAREQ